MLQWFKFSPISLDFGVHWQSHIEYHWKHLDLWQSLGFSFQLHFEGSLWAITSTKDTYLRNFTIRPPIPGCLFQYFLWDQIRLAHSCKLPDFWFYFYGFLYVHLRPQTYHPSFRKVDYYLLLIGHNSSIFEPNFLHSFHIYGTVYNSIPEKMKYY